MRLSDVYAVMTYTKTGGTMRKAELFKSPMTSRQFRGALESLSLSVYAAAPIIGISLRQAQRATRLELKLRLAEVEKLLMRHPSGLKSLISVETEFSYENEINYTDF